VIGRTRAIAFCVGIVALVAALAVLWFVVSHIWNAFAALPIELAVGLLTAATTVVVSTITVIIGRRLERKKEFDLIHRDKKIPIYDDFIKKILRIVFQSAVPEAPGAPVDGAQLLREWQSQIVLWGGADVVNAYLRWKQELQKNPQPATVISLTEDLFLALRRELGHNDRRLQKHAFIGFLLRNPAVYSLALKRDPNITMQDLVSFEASLTKPNA
jgi:hypothetical protein